MKIILDAMGGDLAPEAPVLGAVEAAKAYGTEITLVGRGEAILEALLGVYFNQGGLHAQVSCVSLDDLIDAQLHPQMHRDLRVRVTGYSGVFVDICKRLQDDIINRLK